MYLALFNLFTVPGDFEGQQIIRNGELAAKYFCNVECSTPRSTAPFTWLFFRPPWATVGICCKECVFENMKKFVLSENMKKSSRSEVS